MLLPAMTPPNCQCVRSSEPDGMASGPLGFDIGEIVAGKYGEAVPTDGVCGTGDATVLGVGAASGLDVVETGDDLDVVKATVDDLAVVVVVLSGVMVFRFGKFARVVHALVTVSVDVVDGDQIRVVASVAVDEDGAGIEVETPTTDSETRDAGVVVTGPGIVERAA